MAELLLGQRQRLRQDSNHSQLHSYALIMLIPRSDCECPPTQDWCDCPSTSTTFRIFVGVGVAVWFIVFIGLMACWYRRRKAQSRQSRLVADLNTSFSPYNTYGQGGVQREETLPLYSTKDVDPPLYAASPNGSVESLHQEQALAQTQHQLPTNLIPGRS